MDDYIKFYSCNDFFMIVVLSRGNNKRTHEETGTRLIRYSHTHVSPIYRYFYCRNQNLLRCFKYSNIIGIMSILSSEKHKLCMIDCKSLQLSECTENLKTIALISTTGSCKTAFCKLFELNYSYRLNEPTKGLLQKGHESIFKRTIWNKERM